jgi:hypothetical protein
MDYSELLNRISSLNKENQYTVKVFIDFLEKEEQKKLIEDESKVLDLIKVHGVISFFELANLIKSLPIHKSSWGYFLRSDIHSWAQTHFKCSHEEAFLMIETLIKYKYLKVSSEGNLQ